MNFLVFAFATWLSTFTETCTGLDGDFFLFDLSDDPYEATNVYYNAKYLKTVETLESGAADWIGKIGEPDVPDTTDKSSTWKAAGAVVVPWIEDTTSRNISRLYHYKNAPNIIFFLVDDWGYNDIGYTSSYMPDSTPTISRMASEGIKLTNYFTHDLCTPSRAAFLTGRYPIRLGLATEREGGELALTEVTIAEELKTAGYRNYIVGKWHVGMSSYARTPLYRGFDYFYGYYGGFVDYWTKEYGGFLDLHEGEDTVEDEDELSSDLHSAMLFERKAEEIIALHAKKYSHSPMFLYMASQLIHEDWQAPVEYLQRCLLHNTSQVSVEQYTYCAMNLLLDEIVANLTCTLEKHNMADNTVFILASDNGGSKAMPGNMSPFRGNKGSYYRGGVTAVSFIHSPLVPHSLRGSEYDGVVHVTDWLPTIMGLATDYEWTGSMTGAEIDGVDCWSAIMEGLDSPHPEIVHWVDEYGNCSYQLDMMKLDISPSGVVPDYSDPEYVFENDYGDSFATVCSEATLLSDDDDNDGDDDDADATTDDSTADDTADDNTTTTTDDDEASEDDEEEDEEEEETDDSTEVVVHQSTSTAMEAIVQGVLAFLSVIIIGGCSIVLYFRFCTSQVPFRHEYAVIPTKDPERVGYNTIAAVTAALEARSF